MRERDLVLNASPCDTNLHPDGPQTVAEARGIGRAFCPHIQMCKESGYLHPFDGRVCILQMGTKVAQWALKECHGVAAEMLDFRREVPNPSQGWVWSPDRETFGVITDQEVAIVKVAEFAGVVLGTTAGS